MNKTTIDWCEMTWNPITGCLYDCEYCYAQKVVKRFGKETIFNLPSDEQMHIKMLASKKGFELSESCENPFPFGFAPTFHQYRLTESQKVKTPQTVFVGSMADMFGEWIPDEWIQGVLEACEVAPWHQYIFLTKNPMRYIQHFRPPLVCRGNMFFGATAIDGDSAIYSIEALREHHANSGNNIFISLEPLYGQIGRYSLNVLKYLNWVILGAETGNRKGKIILKREWIEEIVEACCVSNVPVFLKNNLAGIWGEPLIQQFPWKRR